jgi:hypothetical protein
MSDFIGFAVDGIPELQAILNNLPQDIQDAAVDEINKYLVNVMQSGQPSPNYVTRKAAYGVTFFTEKQRRWFFANLNSGGINVPYRRTQGLRNSWKIEGSGARSFIINDAPGAGYVMGDDTQSRHEKMVGWPTVGKLIDKSMARINKILEAVANKIMRKKGAK